MEEDAEPSNEEPPLFSFGCLAILCIFIPLIIFYPLKASIGLFFIYATHVGYKEDMEREKRRSNRKNL